MKFCQSSSSLSPAEVEGRKQRSDGAQAREHLLLTALRLFSGQGFAKTSIREIAKAAGANVAAISYYFGDKAGLYRAVFTEPLGKSMHDISRYDQPHFTLRQSLEGFFSAFLEPLRQGDIVQQGVRLHFREMLDPTGLWLEEIEKSIKPAHAALLAMLGRELGVATPDDDLHRLVFSIYGLAAQVFVSRDIVNALRPQLFTGMDAPERWTAAMVDYAVAMVGIEAVRRANMVASLAATPSSINPPHEKT